MRKTFISAGFYSHFLRSYHAHSVTRRPPSINFNHLLAQTISYVIMSRLLWHRNFQLFRSVVARWTPTSSQPLTLVWDVNHRTVQDTLLKLRERYAVSFEDRNLGYALSVFIQKTELESYILHKISFRMTENENGDDTISLHIPNVDRLAEHFVSLEGNLADKCYVWVKWQLESDPSRASHHIYDDEVVWTIAKTMQRIIFPYYIKRYITLLQILGFPYYGQLFMDAYENASYIRASAEEYTSSPLQVYTEEKFYLVNMANPDKQREKIRFQKLCNNFCV